MTTRRVVLFLALLVLASAGAWGQVVINPAALTNVPLPVGQPIPSMQLATNFPNAPNAWSVSSGSFPPGLNLDPAAGTITGAPTQAGAFTFTVSVTDIEINQQGSRQYTLYISLGPPLS